MRRNQKGFAFIHFAFVLLISCGLIFASSSLFQNLSKGSVSLKLKTRAYQLADSGIALGRKSLEKISQDKPWIIESSGGRIILEKLSVNGKIVLRCKGIAYNANKKFEYNRIVEL